MTLQARTQSIERPVVRCGICHREIHPDSAVLPIFGCVGGRCRARHAAMTATLKREGLSEFLDGSVQFEPIESTDGNGDPIMVYPDHIMRLSNQATRLGLRIVHSWPRTDGPAYLELRLPQGKEARGKLLKRLERLGAAA